MGGWSERVMGQKGFFDVERRLEAISAKGDPLETIKKIVPGEDCRAGIEAVTETKREQRKSNACRKPYDTILKLKIVVLQSLHNLSDERTEYLIRDRISFMRFLDLELDDPVPDATTIWLFREALAQAGLIDRLFERFGQHLEAEGYIARGGQIIDATIVSVPKQRNTKEENEAIKAGKTPEGWEQQPAKNAQKDKDARWTKKNDASFYGYKNHLGVDKAHKLIRKWDATDAAVHDSQKLEYYPRLVFLAASTRLGLDAACFPSHLRLELNRRTKFFWCPTAAGDIKKGGPRTISAPPTGGWDMSRETIWTKAAYELLYKQLVQRFGPHKDWPGQTPAKRKEFEQFCAIFAEVVGAKSARAVKIQIRFADRINGHNEHIGIRARRGSRC